MTTDEHGQQPDPAVIEGVRSAVERTPENSALRTHLADLLVSAGQPGEALEHVERVLEQEPENQAALAVAARAGDALGPSAPVRKTKKKKKAGAKVQGLHALRATPSGAGLEL